jgi:ATP-dependent protease ClpP protease subunit
MNDATRDLWLSAEEALEYGIIDEIVKTKKKGN